jgi:hypothetical protein
MPTPLIPDTAIFQRKLATLPLVTYRAGETVLSAASTTGRLSRSFAWQPYWHSVSTAPIGGSLS